MTALCGSASIAEVEAAVTGVGASAMEAAFTVEERYKVNHIRGVAYRWTCPTSFAKPIIETHGASTITRWTAATVELGDVGDQRGAAASHRNTPGWSGGMGCDPDDLSGH